MLHRHVALLILIQRAANNYKRKSAAAEPALLDACLQRHSQAAASKLVCGQGGREGRAVTLLFRGVENQG